MTKSKIIETLNTLPDEISIDDLLDKLVFINKVENGLKQSERGESISTEEAKNRLDKWLKK